jgi:hypothetical protein
LTYKSNIPEQNIIDEYIQSCSEDEYSDIEEISYCVQAMKNKEYKTAITDLIIEKHMKHVDSKQYERLITYYKKITELKNNNIQQGE